MASDFCILQPENVGLRCVNVYKKCNNCGWNPDVEEERKAEIREKLKEGKNDD